MHETAQAWYCPFCGAELLRMVDEPDAVARVLADGPASMTVPEAVDEAMRRRDLIVDLRLHLAARGHDCPHWWQRVRFVLWKWVHRV